MFYAVSPSAETEPVRSETTPSPSLSTTLPPSLLARFSHEVRTQLTSLRYISDYLNSSTDASSSQWRSLQLLSQNMGVLERLVTDLFFVSEWEESNFQLQRETLEFEKFVWSVVREARGELEAAGITLTVMLAGLGERPLVADTRRLRWALLQIIRNGVQYGQTTTALEIAARREKMNVEFRISDDGQGIRAEEMPHIFERFYRGDAAVAMGERQDIRGLGQGLFFARALAEAHGGSLDMTSEPGSGAQFTMRIPVIEPLQP